jgi:hypothetical protein
MGGNLNVRFLKSQDAIDEHRRCAVRHAAERADTRLGVKLTEADVLQLGLMIWAGRARLMGYGGGGRRLLHVPLGKNKWALAVFDKDLRRIVTFLSRAREWRGDLSDLGRELSRMEMQP